MITKIYRVQPTLVISNLHPLWLIVNGRHILMQLTPLTFKINMQNEDEGTCKWCPHNIFKNHALVSVNRGGGDPRGIEGDSVITNEILSECPKGFNNVSLEKGLMYFYVGNQDDN